MIEILGVNRSISFALIIGSMGMWMTYAELYTVGSVLISSSYPFVANAITTASSRWYGPKGRNIATGIMLISLSLPASIEAVIDDDFERKLKLPLPILTTIMIFISIIFNYERPEFSPTMSEEDKIEMKRVNP